MPFVCETSCSVCVDHNACDIDCIHRCSLLVSYHQRRTWMLCRSCLDESHLSVQAAQIIQQTGSKICLGMVVHRAGQGKEIDNLGSRVE